MPRFLIVTALIAAVLSAPASARQKQMAPVGPKPEIETLVKRQTDFLMKKDAAALADLFSDDAVYATASGEIFSGRAKIRDYYSKTIPGLGDNFTRESTTDEVHVAGTTAWALGHGRTVIRTQEGVADLRDHWVAIYETVGGEWKVRALSLGENVALMPAKY
jgi:uncharacterized protein (TIGR02246 family)